MKQGQAQAKKKRDEASQHPGSEAKRIFLRRSKAGQVESDREGESQRCDDDSPTQKSLAWFRLRSCQPLFGKSNRFFIFHVTQKGQKAKNDSQRANNAEAGKDVVHARSFPVDDSIERKLNSFQGNSNTPLQNDDDSHLLDYTIFVRRVFFTLLLVFSLTACTVLVPSATPTASIVPSTPAPLRGEWMGAAIIAGGRQSLLINFDTETLSIEPQTDTWSVKSSRKGDVSTFSAAGEPDDPFTQIHFSGAFSGGYLSGELTWDGQNSLVTFIPISSVESSGLEKFEGVYRFESGRYLSIIVSPSFSADGLQFFGPTLMMTDFKSGALRALYPVDDSTFLIGALRVVGAPFGGRIRFETDDQGTIQGLRWWQTPHDLFTSPVPGFYASRISYTSADVPFTSEDGTQLMGRLSLPESTSPTAAFMMLHGSERGTRDNFSNKLMAHYMLSHGFAILNYDKRGVGDSQGIYQESANATNLQRHAEDAIAGVEYLAARPEVDATRIGLIGFSQAGWIIPLAASQSESISHFVSLSGPVASTSHESMFSSYTNDGDSSRNFDDTAITEQLRDLKPAGFDPIPIIAELDQPGLWLWGSVDKSVPVTFSAENLQALIDSGKSNYSYQVLPNGDHGLNASLQGLFTEIPYSPGVLYYAALDEWLQTNMSSAK